LSKKAAITQSFKKGPNSVGLFGVSTISSNSFRPFFRFFESSNSFSPILRLFELLNSFCRIIWLFESSNPSCPIFGLFESPNSCRLIPGLLESSNPFCPVLWLFELSYVELSADSMTRCPKFAIGFIILLIFRSWFSVELSFVGTTVERCRMEDSSKMDGRRIGSVE
jgi:hypothetical protein